MPTFDTPTPISVTLELVAGGVRIAAGERADTVVEVLPSDPSREADVKDAARTRVDYADGRLTIKTPKRRSYFGRGSSIEVSIALPSGSEVHGTGAMVEFSSEGRLGACELKTSAGDIRLDETGPVRARTTHGDVTIGRATGHADVATGSGALRIRRLDGSATIKNSNGASSVGEAAGEVHVRAANGDISIDRARGPVDAKTACGSVRIGEVVRGSIVLQTSAGGLEVGIAEGTAAWLDVSTSLGHVHTALDAAEGHADAAETVAVRARTSYGDIVVSRAADLAR
jgi:hypothetical protein